MFVEYTVDLVDLPRDCIDDCSASGDVTEAVRHWRRTLPFAVDRARALDCLQGYGAWEREALEAMDDDDLAEKILWLACGTFHDYIVECEDEGIDPTNTASSYETRNGSPVFFLE